MYAHSCTNAHSPLIHAQPIDESEVLGCELRHGACKLLYTELQLHAPTRKAAQAIFLQVCARDT